MQKAERLEELQALLLDFSWLEAKLAATDASRLLVDYETAPSNTSLELVKSAIRLSAHVLAQNKTQLPSQLTGRLLS